MIKRFPLFLALFIIILQPLNNHADSQKHIEIFDPQENKVVRKREVTEEIYEMVVNWLEKIEKFHPSVNPIKDDGYAVRFPLVPAIKVENKWLNTTVDEVYLIVPEKEQPFLVIFNNENSPIFFLFNGDIGGLSEKLNFQLK